MTLDSDALRVALQAIAEGYMVEVFDDRYIRIENPEHRPDNGSDPFLLIDVASLPAASPSLAGEVLQTADVVRHIPTGEEWVVAWADYSTGYMAPCGWPECQAKIADCALLRKGSEAERHKLIDDLADSGRRDALKARALASREPSPVASGLVERAYKPDVTLSTLEHYLSGAENGLCKVPRRVVSDAVAALASRAAHITALEAKVAKLTKERDEALRNGELSLLEEWRDGGPTIRMEDGSTQIGEWGKKDFAHVISRVFKAMRGENS